MQSNLRHVGEISGQSYQRGGLLKEQLKRSLRELHRQPRCLLEIPDSAPNARQLKYSPSLCPCQEVFS